MPKAKSKAESMKGKRAAEQAELDQAILAFRSFCGPDLTDTLARAEAAARGLTAERFEDALYAFGASHDALSGAGHLKRIVGQINVVVHALGILLCLPKILEAGEIVQDVSLGAGNTGRPFDLETDRRIAEFKFIQWRGGAESIRQNVLFKDFFRLAEHDTHKKKCLYVLGTEHPLKFLNGRRALASVFSRDLRLSQLFLAKYGTQYQTVREYYQPRQADVTIQDVSPWLGGLGLPSFEAAESA
ncbi:MAG TPA: hypothetical protein VGW57_07520 [Chthoniobacterales bacterium]|nr:hypothetical protein [Chthoniobacterales bacterium]